MIAEADRLRGPVALLLLTTFPWLVPPWGTRVGAALRALLVSSAAARGAAGLRILLRGPCLARWRLLRALTAWLLIPLIPLIPLARNPWFLARPRSRGGWAAL